MLVDAWWSHWTEEGLIHQRASRSLLLLAEHPSSCCTSSQGYLTSTRTPMIISGLTSAIPSFLWTSGFLLPPLASSLLHYLSAQHRNHLSPLVCTSAAGKQITNHSLDISHCLRSTRTSHSSPLSPPVSPCCCFALDRSSRT
ncbi:hypothetical protein AMECASPLE_031509 [Ameca splendens]|uniref:Uncharacterized protein n=1 Tax=Ameca splendens TaxID=208324 RepID=A0ABV0YTS6_9TELE